MKRAIITIALLFTLALLVGACNRLAETVTKTTVVARGDISAKLTAAELWNQYESNPTKADIDYKGKWLEITDSGRVKTVQIDGRNAVGMMIVFGGSADAASEADRLLFREGYPPSVRAFMKAGHEKQFATILDKKNPKITLVGQCKGRHDLAGAYKGFVIDLESCEPVKPAETAD